MKLNYKRTILVGFAFFLICAFWQAYDNTIPLILTNKFGMSQAWSGVIMALDNILALFLLPLFGAISDRCTSRRGRRTPFIVVGTLIAAVLLIALSFAPFAAKKCAVWPLTIACTAVQSVCAALPLGPLSSLANALPFSSLGFGWLLPAAAGLVLGLVLPQAEQA